MGANNDTDMTVERTYGRLKWDGGETMETDDISIIVTPPFRPKPSSQQAIVMYKEPGITQTYCDRLHTFPAKNMVELGVKSGGSAVFFTHLMPIEKYVGIELGASAPHLDDYVARKGLQEKMRRYYDTDQSDTARLQEILDSEFGDNPIDLVVDDASHAYAETLASFDVLFPRVRPGGYFILEDWSWNAMWAKEGSTKSITHADGTVTDAFKEPLYNMVSELTLIMSMYPDLIADIEIHPISAFIKRGPMPINGAFRLKDYLVTKNFGPLRFGNMD